MTKKDRLFAATLVVGFVGLNVHLAIRDFRMLLLAYAGTFAGCLAIAVLLGIAAFASWIQEQADAERSPEATPVVEEEPEVIAVPRQWANRWEALASELPSRGMPPLPPLRRAGVWAKLRSMGGVK